MQMACFIRVARPCAIAGIIGNSILFARVLI